MGLRFYKILIVLIFLLFANNTFAQKRIRRTNNFTNYKNHVNEIGYSLNMSYLKYEASFAPYLYLHYTRKLNGFFALGVGYGSIYDKHFHNSLNLETAFRIDDQLGFCLKPGFEFENVNGELNWSYSIGFEIVYEFRITDDIRFGPVAEINFLQDDTVYILGFHMGFTY